MSQAWLGQKLQTPNNDKIWSKLNLDSNSWPETIEAGGREENATQNKIWTKYEDSDYLQVLAACFFLGLVYVTQMVLVNGHVKLQLKNSMIWILVELLESEIDIKPELLKQIETSI